MFNYDINTTKLVSVSLWSDKFCVRTTSSSGYRNSHPTWNIDPGQWAVAKIFWRGATNDHWEGRQVRQERTSRAPMQVKWEKLVMAFFSSAAAFSRSLDGRLTGKELSNQRWFAVMCGAFMSVRVLSYVCMSVLNRFSSRETVEWNSKRIDNTRDARNSLKYRNGQFAIYRCTLQRSYQQNFF